MPSVTFRYRSKRETSTLNARFLHRISKGNEIDITSRIQVEVSKEYWQKKHKLKRVNDIDIANKQTVLNNEFTKISNFILKAFKEVDAETVNKEWLSNTIHNYYNPIEVIKLPTELIEYIDYYIEARKNELSNNSIKKIKVVKGKFEKFQEFKKRTFLIKDVDLNFKKELESYLESKGYAPNTITRDIRYLKTFCNHAKYNGIETSYQLEKVQAKYIPTENIYLTTEEIELIEKPKKILPDHLENARKWLLISCYTGQRISDFLRFTMEMVRFEGEVALIEFTQRKTGKIMTVPLSTKALALLKSNPLRISDQRYNDYIKLVCEKVGITQKVKGSKKIETEKDSGIYRKKEGLYRKCDLVSSHIGRRSFATNNYGKIQTSFLKYVTGHSTESMFLEYIGKSNKDIAIELSKHLG
tara:strand:+ start:557 stop:1798 length:1242 start_codon:yes stop_codon:yes gene_type:complete